MPGPDDRRAAVRAAVAAREPVDERERSARGRILAELDRLADPFDEHADAVHVTASAIVVGRRGVVLLRHKRLGIWVQPGGHLDPGEVPAVAAIREATEETGLELVHHAGRPQLVHVDVHPGGRGHTHLDLRYLLAAADADPAPPAGESQEVAWLSWAEAVRRADPGLRSALVALWPADPASVRIRPASPADAPALAEVYLRSRRAALAGFPWAHGDDEVRAWVRDVLLPGGDAVALEVAGVAIGVMAHRDGWIDQLYLDPPWWGRRLGDRLIEHAKRHSPSGLQLWTFQENDLARRFYARHGFAETELTGGAGNEEGRPDVRLTWPGATAPR